MSPMRTGRAKLAFGVDGMVGVFGVEAHAVRAPTMG